MLIDQSWTDEEYRYLEQMYLRLVTEAERIIAMLEEISNYIGAVWSPSLVLTGLGLASGNIPTLYYDQNGAAGMVFVAAPFNRRDIAKRFETARRKISALYETHKVERIGSAEDPAFEIIRHLNNNWWGSKPTVNEAWPNAFADELMERYPVDSVSTGPDAIVHGGKVYQRVEFRQYSDEEAVIVGGVAYIEDDDIAIVSGPTDYPHGQEFTIDGWYAMPINVKGSDGKWYLTQLKPAQFAQDDK